MNYKPKNMSVSKKPVTRAGSLGAISDKEAQMMKRQMPSPAKVARPGALGAIRKAAKPGARMIKRLFN